MKKLLGYSDLIERGYGSRTNIWRKVKSGEYPTPRSIGGHPKWRLSDIEAFENDSEDYDSQAYPGSQRNNRKE